MGEKKILGSIEQRSKIKRLGREQQSLNACLYLVAVLKFRVEFALNAKICLRLKALYSAETDLAPLILELSL
ncbi:hypothetical protein BK645_26280 [Pseudomonas protegens]|nr:hypothetical protein BK645_26280 [Pseudomonas protegens]ROM42617.1 hypothetical protein BK646_04285 [Pseudomonas protegens]